jgi:indolepyruvate decarboxylase
VLDAAASYKRPVYLELPRDMVHVRPNVPHEYRHVERHSEPEPLSAAVDEAAEWIGRARRPVILAGVEIHRFGLQGQVVQLAEQCGIPMAATMLGKSVIRETHPLYIGLYEGALGYDEVTRYIESSDCVLVLGAFMTDINLGIYTANLDPSNCIYVTSEQLRVRHHHYHGVVLEEFLRALVARRPRPQAVAAALPKLARDGEPFVLRPEAPIRIMRMIARLNQQLDEETVVVADIGDALFAATELVTHEHTEFLSAAYYTSMGFGIPAALGAQVARPAARTVVIVGDGAFQMTGMEMSTLVRHKFPTIVLLLDNKGYGTERVLHPGNHAFNNIHPWNYHKLPEIFGGGTGYEVRTEGEFDAALRRAWADRSGPSLIQIHLALDDRSQALDRLAERLSKRV